MSEDKWISVEDRLPTDSRYVLVVMDGGRIEVNFYLHSIKEWAAKLNVLYWQPLPELPEELKER